MPDKPFYQRLKAVVSRVCNLPAEYYFHQLNYTMVNTVHIINQLFEMEGKINESGMAANFERNFRRLFSIFEEDGFIIQDPTGEAYTESRTDCEASISGKMGNKMIVTRTLKPVIYQKNENGVQLLQKAVVIAENK